MTRTGKIVRNAIIAIAAFIAVALIAAFIVVQTGWFRGFVRNEIVSATEQATGGRVEIGSFDLDISHLQAVITGFVIHGKEPAGTAPFVSVARAEARVRLFPGLRRLYEITFLGVERPQANIIILASGESNIPTPPKKSTSNTSALQTVVNLEIGRFQLNNGLFTVESRSQPMNLQGTNLRAHLDWDTRNQGYQGTLALQPAYSVGGRNTPVTAQVTVPVILQRDRIEIRNASLSTPNSNVSVSGELRDMRNPTASGQLKGHIATVDLKNAGLLPDSTDTSVAPQIDVDANATAGADIVRVSQMRVAMGGSTLDASGTLKDSHGSGPLVFKSQLAIGELSRLFKVNLKAGGNAELDGNVRLDGRNLTLTNLHAAALGARFDGNASFENFERYQLNGSLQALDIRTALREFDERVPYQGMISGEIHATGNTKAPGLTGLAAQARMTIAPRPGGIPVSGRVDVDFNGSDDKIAIRNSFLDLPHTRVALDGSLTGNQIGNLKVALTSRDLNDLLAAVPNVKAPPITLQGGAVTFNATVTGTLSKPAVAGHLAANRFTVEGRRFDSLGADVAASAGGAAVRNGILTRAGTQSEPMKLQFAGAVGLRNWVPVPRASVAADITIRSADLADIMALAGQNPAGYESPLTASAHIGGTVANPQGSAMIDMAAGRIDGEPFDEAKLAVNLTDQLVTIPTAYIKSSAGRADLSAEYRHSPESFSTGTIHAHVQTNQIDLARVRTVQKNQPQSSGTLQITGDVTAESDSAEFRPVTINADIAAQGIKVNGRNYGDLNASARTQNQSVTYNATSDFAGANIRINGSTRLANDYPTTADAVIANLPVERVIAATGTEIPARGFISATAHVEGTAKDPQGTVDLDLTRAVVYDEPIDRARGRITYRSRSIEVPQFEITSGPSRIALSAHYNHPAGDLTQGAAQFSLNSSRIDLTRVRNVQKLRPGLGGTLEISASGEAAVRPGSPRILLSNVAGHIAATGIESQGTKFGDLNLTANTAAGNRLSVALESTLADAAIHGTGTAQLSGDYPVTANLTFNNLLYTHVQALLGTSSGTAPAFEGATDGQITLHGPALKPEQLSGTLQLTRLSLTSSPRPGGGKPVSVTNQGPIELALDAGTVKIQKAQLTGPDTNIEAAGTASLKAFALTVNANANLNLLPQFDRDIDSSGRVIVATTVRGTPSQPLINGQMTLQNAAVNYRGIENGLSNANGVVVFNGNTARVQSLTAESGGGQLSATGFFGFTNILRFGLRATASHVRVRTEQGASVVADGNVQLSGTSDNSTVSGTVTVSQVNYNPRSDLGSILSRAAPPVQAPEAASPILDNMKLDIRVRTATGLSVQASLARNLQADADLQIRGTAATPGILGRVTLNEGQLVFFGSTYTVDRGTIAFYNPLRIEPVLDLTLETQAKTVTVVLHVTGPIDNMNLSYTSDPPLQFQEIVSLLASGKTPTSDPTLLATQGQAPSQSMQQMGESALLGKALADPVSNRLSRVFGVTEFKIDPSFTSGTEIPTARLTLQQQITTNLTFTYTSALDDPNGQIIRIEWAFSPQWSAVANRDQNGIFSINFLYKKQFH